VATQLRIVVRAPSLAPRTETLSFQPRQSFPNGQRFSSHVCC